MSDYEDKDEKIYGLPTAKPDPLCDEDMGYAASLDFGLPKTQEHPTGKVTDSHGITSSWWTQKPKGGTQ